MKEIIYPFGLLLIFGLLLRFLPGIPKKFKRLRNIFPVVFICIVWISAILVTIRAASYLEYRLDVNSFEDNLVAMSGYWEAGYSEVLMANALLEQGDETGARYGYFIAAESLGRASQALDEAGSLEVSLGPLLSFNDLAEAESVLETLKSHYDSAAAGIGYMANLYKTMSTADVPSGDMAGYSLMAVEVVRNIVDEIDRAKSLGTENEQLNATPRWGRFADIIEAFSLSEADWSQLEATSTSG